MGKSLIPVSRKILFKIKPKLYIKNGVPKIIRSHFMSMVSSLKIKVRYFFKKGNLLIKAGIKKTFRPKIY